MCLREVMELRDSSDQDMSNGCLTGCSKQGEGFDFHPANAGRALQELYPDRFNLGLGSLLPRMIELAATETAGVLTYFTPPDKTAQVRAVIRPGR